MCVDSGGMRSSTFVARMRRTSSLRSALPGTIAYLPGVSGNSAVASSPTVEPQAGLARRRVGAVTLEAVLRQDRADVPVVVDLVGRERAEIGVRRGAAVERGDDDDAAASCRDVVVATALRAAVHATAEIIRCRPRLLSD